MAQALDGVVGLLEGHAVAEQADALLEEADGRLGVDAVEPVALAAREAQDVQALLQLAHIAAMEVGKAQVEGAVAQVVALVDEGGPGRRVDRGAQREVVVEAEARDAVRGGLTEQALGAFGLVDGVAERAQPLLDVLDRYAGRSLMDRVHASLPCPS